MNPGHSLHSSTKCRSLAGLLGDLVTRRGSFESCVRKEAVSAGLEAPPMGAQPTTSPASWETHGGASGEQGS